MKKFNFWTLGLTAACLCGLTACSDTVSSEDEFDQNGNKITKQSSSSDEENDSKSSEKEIKSSSSAAVVGSCDSLTASLAAPTDLNIVKSSDSTWILLWTYSANDERPEEVFIIQSLNMSDSIPKWKTIDSTMTDVTMYNLKGKKKAGKYYRVSAKDQCGVSKASSMVQASSTGAGSTSVDANLGVPTNLALDALGDAKWRLTWSYEDNASRPENGFKIQYLDISAEKLTWKDAGKTEKGVRVFKIEGNDKRGYMYRVAAMDANGVSEYSSEITIPQEGTSSTGTDAVVTMAAPTNLTLDSIGQNKWRLSWKHDDKEAHPENGFRLQKLDLNSTKQWAAESETKKGVRFYTIDNSKGAYDEIFIRVAAKDSAGKLSDYSEEILIPTHVDYSNVTTQKTLAAPTDLKLDTLGFGNYQLSWNYDDNADNGFVLQSLDPQNSAGGWKVEKGISIAKGVHLTILDGAGDAGGKLFRVAALAGTAKKDTSLYSAAITIPKVSDDGTVNNGSVTTALNAPKNVEVIDLGQNKYKLAWSYTNSSLRPENGFKIQVLKGNPLTWDDFDVTSKGVYFYIIEAGENEINYRVAAKDDQGESEYSAEVVVPKTMKNPPKEGCIGEFSAPSSLSAERIAPSVWRLKWSYESNLKCLEEGFVIEQFDASDVTKPWKEFGTTLNNTRTFLLEEASDLNKFYRVTANRGDQRSAYSNEFQVTRATAYSADFDFQAPEVKARIYRPTSAYEFEFSVVVTNNFPIHSIINSPYTKSVVYQFRWNGESSWKTVPIDEGKAYSTTLKKDITSMSDLCHSYASVRIMWEETSGVQDSTEWTSPVGPVYNDFEYLPYNDEDKPCQPL